MKVILKHRQKDSLKNIDIFMVGRGEGDEVGFVNFKIPNCTFLPSFSIHICTYAYEGGLHRVHR